MDLFRKLRFVLTSAFLVFLTGGYCLAQTPCPEKFPELPKLNQEIPIFGLTVDNVSNTTGIIEQIKAIRCKNPQAPAPVVRVVFDLVKDKCKTINPDIYLEFLKKVRKEENLALMRKISEPLRLYKMLLRSFISN